jgi:hypothetical protein
MAAHQDYDYIAAGYASSVHTTPYYAPKSRIRMRRLQHPVVTPILELLRHDFRIPALAWTISGTLPRR